jgi:hypothetical protein
MRSGGWQATQTRDSALVRASIGVRPVSMTRLAQTASLPHEIQPWLCLSMQLALLLIQHILKAVPIARNICKVNK